ncbi:2'-5' RNA ligase family protein [Streptomyces sp. NPDC006978]|uniref:2'-5' RNA ligase family protein n=1 Tax=Streptomyces sp. NPDC006978 TaxID=3364769 RepID=UPI0036BE6CAA
MPVDAMHCTLLPAVGLSSKDVDTDALLTAMEISARTLPPFTLTFDRPSVSDVGVEISGWPGRPFTANVDAVTGVMTTRGADFRAAPSRYPHMSLAYASSGSEAVDAVTSRAGLASIEKPLSGTVAVDRLHLVEQWRDGAHITWNPIGEVPLAGVGA